MAKSKSNKKIREALKESLKPNLDMMLGPLEKAISEQENDGDKPYKLTVTLSDKKGVQAKVCLRKCTNKQGNYGLHFCEDCVD